MLKNQYIHIKNSIKITALLLLIFSNHVNAQYGNPWMGQAINQNIMRGKEAASDYERQNKQQAWQAKENAIQAQIERYRSTPYYGSLAVNMHDKGTIYWSGGGIVSDASSIQKALALCGHADCKILKTFSNACAAITYPTDRHEMFVVVDRTPQQAIQRAASACASRYGVDGCRISAYKKANSYAYCSGYDYGAYNQR